MRTIVRVDRTCLHCGTSFTADARVKGTFCSFWCQSHHQRPRTQSVCSHCGRSFSYAKRGDVSVGGRIGKYCSRACYFATKSKRGAERQQREAERARLKREARRCRVCGVAGRGSVCSIECRKAENRQLSRAKFLSERSLLRRSCLDCGARLGNVHRRRVRCPKCADRYEHDRRHADKAVRRARLRGVTCDARITWTEISKRDGWRCRLCGVRTPKRLRGSNDRRAPELDHIVPVSRGGSHVWDNLQLLCRQCNGKKSAKTLGQLALGLASEVTS